MKTLKLLREVLNELRKLSLVFTVQQNRHIKIKVTNPVTAQSAALIVSVSPSGFSYERNFWSQYKEHMREIGVSNTKGEIK
jgi:hypothetical protein